MWSVAASVSQQQSWAAITESIWPKIVWHFTESCRPPGKKRKKQRNKQDNQILHRSAALRKKCSAFRHLWNTSKNYTAAELNFQRQSMSQQEEQGPHMASRGESTLIPLQMSVTARTAGNLKLQEHAPSDPLSYSQRQGTRTPRCL